MCLPNNSACSAGPAPGCAALSTYPPPPAARTLTPTRAAVEGWIVIATGIHEEAAEDDVVDKFSEYGPVKSVSMNLDRRTGYAKGYALLEYAERSQAEAAIKGLTGAKMLGRPLRVDWAFVSK